MPREHFSHVTSWVFDLDNTLYPPDARLFDQIEARMTAFLVRELGVEEEEAAALRRTYWRAHGTTLAGLMEVHGVDPEPYLEEVHEIDLSALDRDPALAAAIRALPGRKIVYTNGSRGHAERVTEARGLDGVFDAVFGVEDAGYAPKPRADAFARVFAAAGVAVEAGAMFEDDPRNLAVPHDLGMKTVLVAEDHPGDAHIHHHTVDLRDFLTRLR
ncbi:MAG: pyrimidine 5'-nucleotidase [Pseudomonadota bacterium]